MESQEKKKNKKKQFDKQQLHPPQAKSEGCSLKVTRTSSCSLYYGRSLVIWFLFRYESLSIKKINLDHENSEQQLWIKLCLSSILKSSRQIRVLLDP